MPITKEQVQQSEKQIYGLRRNIRYSDRELTVKSIVDKYERGSTFNENSNERDFKYYNTLYVPDYQRHFVWNEIQQSSFIESVLLDLPIPLVFVAKNPSSAWEIVYSSQRIHTLHAFVNNQLKLQSLEKLDKFNNFYFKNLDPSRQKKFTSTPLRVIIFSKYTNDEIKRDLLESLNEPMNIMQRQRIDIRRYENVIEDDPRDKFCFTYFIFDITEKDESKVREEEWKKINALLKKLAPMADWLVKKDEQAELLLHFFAFVDHYKELSSKEKSVKDFLNGYLIEKDKLFSKIEKKKYEEKAGKKRTGLSRGGDGNYRFGFIDDRAYVEAREESWIKIEKQFQEYTDKLLPVLTFVDKFSEYGFRDANTKRIRRSVFEALSVGVHLALQEKPDLRCRSEDDLLKIVTSEKFIKTLSGTQNTIYTLLKIKQRIDIVKDALLKL